MELQGLSGELWISRLQPQAPLPTVASGEFFSVTRTPDEISVVGPEPIDGGRVEGPWRAFRVAGVLDFSLTGVLHELTGPLAVAGVSVFVVSTFDTDYILVRSDREATVMQSWISAGHVVRAA